ncbi:cupin [Rhodococcus sp. NPDC058514]|uniref:cupin n=1 Tax=unclassified Rhodococcus (in: high G+C Gram-positive bacteria) TaxID=192944 RepID=UPI003652BD2A
MISSSLNTVFDEHLATAKASPRGISVATVHGGKGKTLRQLLIVMTAGHGLADHESPGEATLQVLRGRVRVEAQGQVWEGAAGDLLDIPDARHNLTATEESAALLTVAVAQS